RIIKAGGRVLLLKGIHRAAPAGARWSKRAGRAEEVALERRHHYAAAIRSPRTGRDASEGRVRDPDVGATGAALSGGVGQREKDAVIVRRPADDVNGSVHNDPFLLNAGRPVIGRIDPVTVEIDRDVQIHDAGVER